MEMQIEMKIFRLEATITIAKSKNPDLLAFGELKFFAENSNDFLFKIVGFTIRRKTFNEVPKIVVVPPAFLAGNKYKTSFFFNDLNIWKDLSSLLLKAYSAETGDAGTQDEEIVDPEDIPF